MLCCGKLLHASLMLWVSQESLTRNNGTKLCGEYIKLSIRQNFLSRDAHPEEKDQFILGRKGTCPKGAGAVISSLWAPNIGTTFTEETEN